MSSDEIFLTIHYTNGTKQRFLIERGNIDKGSVATRLQDALNAQNLVIEVEGSALIVPFHNILYMEVTPPPLFLPITAVKNAKLIA